MYTSKLKKKRSKTILYHPKYWPTWLWLALLRTLILLPYPWLMTLGRWAGRMAMRFIPKRRHITEVNLRLCFPELTDEQRSQRLLACYEAAGMGLMESALGWWGSMNSLPHAVKIEGLELLADAAARGKGILVAGAHFTTLDLAGRLISQFHPVQVIYRRHKNPVFEWVMRRSREQRFTNVIDRENVREILRALKKPIPVWYAADQDYGIQYSVFAPFFNVPAASITATARLAAMTDATVLFFSHHRLKDGSYRLRFQGPIEHFPSGDEQRDTQCINTYIEYAIREFPEQYLWQHRRFKTRPEGEPSVYNVAT